MRAIRWATCAVLLLLVVLGVAAPASAHAELVASDPEQGAVLDSLPDVVTLTFSENVRRVPDAVRVYDAAGEELASSSRSRDDQLFVTIGDPVAAGTVVVAWRVVSEDGHPVVGSLTFSVGAPSPATAVPDTGAAPRAVTTALAVSRWPAYVGLLVAVGLVWYLAFLVPPEFARGAGVLRRARRVARRAAAVGAAGWLAGLVLGAAYLRGTGFGSLTDPATYDTLPRRDVVAVGVLVLALAVAVLSRAGVAAVAALAALVPVALVGHSVAMEHARLNVVVDGFHLVAGATWLGGLVGLGLVLRGTSSRSDVALLAVARFSAAAAAALVALVAAGTVLAWQLVGGWSGLVGGPYGWLLLAKVAVAATAVAVAGFNRYRLLPRATAGRRALARTAGAEAALLVVVVLLTGFLVQEDPPAGVGRGTAAPAAPLTGEADLGGLRATVTVDPGGTGANTVTLEVDNSAGTPAELFTPPRLRVLGEETDVGDVPLRAVSLGVYRADVLLPTPGRWRFQVSVRVDEFTNPVATVALDVR